MRFNRTKSTLIGFESRFNRQFRVDSSGPIYRRDDFDSDSRSEFEFEFEFGPRKVDSIENWSNLHLKRPKMRF